MENNETKKENRMYPIQVTMNGAKETSGRAIEFKRSYYIDGKQMRFESFFVPVNKPVMLPYWVYSAWETSEYNAANPCPVDKGHIVNE